MNKLEPTEIPAYAYQLLSLCTSASLMLIPLYGFNQYFHRHYYNKICNEMESEQSNCDTIGKLIDVFLFIEIYLSSLILIFVIYVEPFSDKEIMEAQDTVLYHLSTCTEFCLTERDVITHFRTLASNPRYILTPFIISALLTMCKINRDLDSSRLSSSTTLQFLRSVIRNNENERALSKKSAWCRLVLEESVVDMDKIYTILIDQRYTNNVNI